MTLNSYLNYSKFPNQFHNKKFIKKIRALFLSKQVFIIKNTKHHIDEISSFLSVMIIGGNFEENPWHIILNIFNPFKMCYNTCKQFIKKPNLKFPPSRQVCMPWVREKMKDRDSQKKKWLWKQIMKLRGILLSVGVYKSVIKRPHTFMPCTFERLYCFLLSAIRSCARLLLF